MSNEGSHVRSLSADSGLDLKREDVLKTAGGCQRKSRTARSPRSPVPSYVSTSREASGPTSKASTARSILTRSHSAYDIHDQEFLLERFDPPKSANVDKLQEILQSRTKELAIRKIVQVLAVNALRAKEEKYQEVIELNRQLSEHLDRAEKQLRAAKVEASEENKNCQKLGQNLENLRQRLSSKTEQAIKLEDQRDRFYRKWKHSDDNARNLKFEFQLLDKEHQHLRNLLEEAVNDRSELSQRIREVEENMLQTMLKYNQLLEKLEETRERCSREHNRKQELEIERERLKRDISHKTHRIETMETETKLLQDMLGTKAESTNALMRTVDDLKSACLLKDEALQQEKQLREQLEQAMAKTQGFLQESRREAKELKEHMLNQHLQQKISSKDLRRDRPRLWIDWNSPLTFRHWTIPIALLNLLEFYQMSQQF